jgi:Domain of Unknown Function (DUF748)
VNIESSGKKWAADTIFAKFSFREGKSEGTMNGNFTINLSNLNYRLGVKANDFDLEIIRQYIWELINYGMFRAHLDAQLNAIGNFNSQDSISVAGRFALRDFHLGKTSEDDYMAFEKLAIVMEEVSPIHRKYLFDSIALIKSYLKYERYDSLDNVETMFGKAGKNISDVTQQAGRFNLVIEIARYVEVLSRNFFRSDYKIGKLSVSDAHLVFNDYSLAEKFSIQASALSIKADSVNNNHKRVGVSFTTDFKPSGKASLFVSINPKDSGDFDLTYQVEKIPASVFNPYLLSYTSFPVDRGTLEVTGKWNVRNGKIKSDNHIVIIDPRLTSRVRNKDMKWMPMPLIMSFVRERGNVIDYSVPITGNLNDPKFHWRDVVFDLVKNVFVKPPTTPYRVEVKNIETEIEKSLTVKWDMQQPTLKWHQRNFVTKLSRHLRDHPEASVTIHPFVYDAKEREYILFFETKKKYFLVSQNKSARDFSENDSLTVSRMSIRDPALGAFVGKNLSDTVMFTLQEKCINFVGREIIATRLKVLARDRETSFRAAFVDNETNGRVKIAASKNDIPYNGFSYYRLEYTGELPNALRKAYAKMNDLNDEGPRRKYLDRRKDRDLLNQSR